MLTIKTTWLYLYAQSSENLDPLADIDTASSDSNEDNDLYDYDRTGLGIIEEQWHGDKENIVESLVLEESESQTSASPEWLQGLFKEKLDICKQCTRNSNIPDLYLVHKTFWLPWTSAFF
ncbi:hypothetical protein FRC14_007899 [Serendipita sp. 396]|nr:hypothetical protein FRC14_007899 [Serendipita sp. 396]KAG8776701.1 hypothetical protein FRC15_011802 [Serendipita sp. 397]KAG8821211.1 hypothetical protein FRC19_008160 [Serendipita sp. 401]KAG8825309.1 hypothetical protein FRC18_010346 [Serendipita sp. 400]KAG8859441.1 hypothetical protein FRC20_011833 [Serendipita sp. 405]KAG9048866.1 hypothetical protein FS842_000282 [Serendipita sp. 407]